MKTMLKRWTALGFALAAAGCAGSAVPTAGQAPPTGGQQKPVIPVGFGTLKQDEFTMALRSGPLLIKVVPLSEYVIRTAAPDTYKRLNAMAESRREEALRTAGAVGEAELFLVSFFSYEPDVVFQPENLQVTHQGRQMRAVAIVPLTPEWGQQRLKQQDNQSAIYAFTGKFDYDLGITVRYGLDQTDAWSNIVSKLETERAKILARAGAK